MRVIREVRKRDARLVPFDESKIAGSIFCALRGEAASARGDAAAQSSLGAATPRSLLPGADPDHSLSQDLAAAVTHFLEQRLAGAIPSVDEIQDQIETVLIECGHTDAARAFMIVRRKRAVMREALQVRKRDRVQLHDGREPSAAERGSEAPSGTLSVENRGETAPWSKQKIVAALVREADMEVSAAEDVASAVEEKVLAAGMGRISTSLVRELVDNELFVRGHRSKLRQQAPLAVPKYNLEQMLFGHDSKEGFTFPKTPHQVQELIASQILQEYALQEVFSPQVVDLHREGRVHIHGIESPLWLARLTLDPRSDPTCGGDNSGSGLEGFFHKLAHISQFVAGEIVIRDPGVLFGLGSDPRAPQGGGPRARPACRTPEERQLCAFLLRMGAVSTRSALAVELPLESGTLPWLRAFPVSQLRGRVSLRLRLGELDLEVGEGYALVEAAALLLDRGVAVEFAPGGGASVPSYRGSVAGAFAVTINLPRAALRSAADRAGDFERELDDVVERVVRCQLERRRFLERLGAHRETPLWELLGRPTAPDARPRLDLADVDFPVGLLGLNECVKLLTGSELHQEPRARSVGLDLVHSLQRALERSARSVGLRLTLVETQNRGAVRRLEESDLRRFESSAQIDLGRLRRPAPRAVAPAGFGVAGGGRGSGLHDDCEELGRYSSGVRMHPSAPVDPLRRLDHLAGFLPSLEPCGLIEGLHSLCDGGAELLASLLEEARPLVALKQGGSRPCEVKQGSRPRADRRGGDERPLEVRPAAG